MGIEVLSLPYKGGQLFVELEKLLADQEALAKQISAASSKNDEVALLSKGRSNKIKFPWKKEKRW